MHLEPAFLSDWSRVPGVDPFAQREYLGAEILRAARAGAPILTALLTAPLEVQSALGLLLVSKEAVLQQAGLRPYFPLRLKPGARLHPSLHKDPQGRDLPADKAGRVLVVKVNTLGGMLDGSHAMPERVVGQWSGAALAARAARGEPLYRNVEIGAEPVELPFEDAVCVLRKYGVGVAKQFTKFGVEAGRRHDGAVIEKQSLRDNWLVEELPLVAPAPAAAPGGGKSRAA